MKEIKKILKIILICTVIMNTLTTYLLAQKLPNKQEKSVWAPSAIKIDGKTDEWDNKFEAYNHATGLFYTISNNDDNLYITIQCRDNNTIDKINGGGITVSLGNPHKGAQSGASITYAAISTKSRFRINALKRDTAVDHLSDINKEVASAENDIEVKNFDSIPDGQLSIYNQYHIMAAVLYNDKHTYSYELCIPLKYIKSYFNDITAINYKIQLNGEDVNGNNMAVRVNGKEQSTMSPETKAMVNSIIMTSSKTGTLRDLVSPTNFSGTYSLAKKI